MANIASSKVADSIMEGIEHTTGIAVTKEFNSDSASEEESSDDVTDQSYNLPFPVPQIVKRAPRHSAMNEQQQIERIAELEEKLKVFGAATEQPPESKKRKTLTPEPEAIKTEQEVHATKMTPPAEKPEKTKPQKMKKQDNSALGHIPPQIKRLMATLNTFGIPFERVLSSAVSDAQTELGRMDGNELVVTELQSVEREWKTANRASLKKMETLLSRNGVVAIGGVEIPAGKL